MLWLPNCNIASCEPGLWQSYFDRWGLVSVVADAKALLQETIFDVVGLWSASASARTIGVAFSARDHRKRH
jgi:hypothetical protein